MDVDGTLANNEKNISKDTKEALIKAQELGILVILASGRTPRGLSKYIKDLKMEQHHGLIVAYNGSRVMDCTTNEILFDQTMSIEEGKAVLNHMKNFDRIRPIIDKDDYMYVTDVYDNYINWNGGPYNVMEYESRSNGYKLCEVDDLAEFLDYPINKILTISGPEYLQKHYQEMMAPFKDSLSCMFTGPFYFEFTAKGIDKAKALDTVLKPMGYKREDMIAFGDGHNDESIMKYAGIGVAMENAVDSLKEIADEITSSNDEDGIAKSLYKHIPELRI